MCRIDQPRVVQIHTFQNRGSRGRGSDGAAATALTQPMAAAVNDTGPFVVVSALIAGATAVVPVA